MNNIMKIGQCWARKANCDTFNPRGSWDTTRFEIIIDCGFGVRVSNYRVFCIRSSTISRRKNVVRMS